MNCWKILLYIFSIFNIIWKKKEMSNEYGYGRVNKNYILLRIIFIWHRKIKYIVTIILCAGIRCFLTDIKVYKEIIMNIFLNKIIYGFT